MASNPIAARPTTVPTSHNGIRPVVPVLDIFVSPKRNYVQSEKDMYLVKDITRE
jgi:hypothetical protein